MIKWFGKVSKGISLSTKLVLMFLMLSIIPVLVVGLISARVSSNIVLEKEITRRMEELNLVRNDVMRIIREIDLVSIRYMLDSNVQTLFKDDGDLNDYEKKMLEFEIEKLIFANHTYWINSTYLFSYTDIVCCREKLDKKTLDEYYARKWFRDGMADRDVKFIGDLEVIGNSRVIPFVRKIFDFKTNEVIGVSVINLNETIIRQTYVGTLSDSGKNMIVNENGCILSSTDRRYTGEIIYDVLGMDPVTLAGQDTFFEHEFSGQKMLMITNRDANLGWTYYSIVPMSDVLVGTVTINTLTISLIGICAAFCIFLSYFLSKRVTLPINKLSLFMRKAELGDLDTSYPVRHYDEIGKLGDSFNKMIKRLKTSMQETIDMQQKKMEAELKVLEFQINPHFLYNTLSSIIWLADEGRNEEVIGTTKALANFFRISLNRGKEMIRVGEEVEHVINYMEIQKLRYGNVSFVHDIDIEILGCYTLKLLLQPIIENALYHGVRLLDKRGVIKLSAYKDRSDLVFVISDNGNKLSHNDVRQINKALSLNKKSDLGIGLKNVNDRVKLHFGEQYGMKFSVKDKCTVVEIRVPLIESEVNDVQSSDS